MTVLLDTNIIMDALQERHPFDTAAKQIMLLGQSGKINCCFTANAVTDIFFLYSKARSRKEANTALSFLLNTYKVVKITQEDCLKALALPNEDLEDSLVEVCAKNINADYIISRDEKFKAVATEVKVIKPDDFISLI